MINLRKAAEMALEALMDANKFEYKDEIAALRQALAQGEHPLDKKADNARELGLDYEPVGNEKVGSPCPEFWDWLPKAYNFEGSRTFSKYNMEVAFLAGKNTALAQPKQEPVAAVELLTIGKEQIIAVAWYDSNAFKVGTKLYTRPTSKQKEQE